MIDLVRYVVVRSGVPTPAARQWLADQGASNLAIDDAIEDSAQHDLIRESADRIEPTLRGQAWLLALKDGPSTRAARLYLDQDRPKRNPSQASFAWAGDPRQLGLFDRAPIPAAAPVEPEAERDTEAERARMGAFSSAQFRYAQATRPKPKRAPKPKAPKRAWGRIELDAAGNLSTKGVRAWSERAIRGLSDPLGSDGPELPWPPDRSWHAVKDAWRLWAAHPDDKDRWHRFWRDYRDIWTDDEGEPLLHNGYTLTHEYALKRRWIELASADRDRDAHDYARGAGLGIADDFAYARLREAVAAARIASWGGPDEERSTRREVDAAWIVLLNRWLDKRWDYPKRNPEAGASTGSTREKGERTRRRQAAQSEIRMARAEQKRARAERRIELDRAREQTKRIRGKVTEASAGRRTRIRQRAHERIDRANARIAELRATKAWLAGKDPKRGHGRVWEQNEEVEAEVRHLDPMLVPLWRANRGLFKGTPHERFERFLEWADEQGEAEVWTAIEKTLPTDRQLARDYEAWAEEQSAA